MRVKNFIYNLQHAQRNMSGCLFFHGERLLYVRDVVFSSRSDNYVLCAYYVDDESRQEELIPLDDNISVKAFPLGYVNIPEERAVASVIRSTTRLYQYGLCAEHLVIESNPVRWGRQTMLTSIHLARTIMQQFPTIREAQELGGCAFHNDYLLYNNIILWRYWENPIGAIKHDEIELLRPFAFLKEELAEITGMLTVPC